MAHKLQAVKLLSALSIKNPVYLLLALAGATATSFVPPLAARSPSPPPLTLQESVREALAGNPEILKAGAALKSAEGLRIDAGILVPSNPELELSRSREAGQGDSSNDWRISQEFWLPGQRHYRKAAANSNLDAARWDLVWARRRLAAEVVSTYAEVKLLEEKEVAINQLAELNQRLSEAAEMKFKAGEISFLDNSLLQIETRRSQGEALRLRRAAAAARERMGRLLGRNLPVNETLMPLPEMLAIMARPAATTVDVRQRPDVASALAHRLAAERALSATRLDLLPRPTLFAGESRQTTVFRQDDFRYLAGFTPSLAGVNNASRSRVYGIRFSIPIFNWNRGAMRQAGAALDRAQADEQAVRQAYLSEIRLQRLGFETEAETYRLIAAVLPDVRENLALLEKGYRAGQFSLNDMLLQKDRLYRALIDHSDTALALIRARADLAASEGDFTVFQLPPEVDDHAH